MAGSVGGDGRNRDAPASTLSAYLREVGPIPVLTPDEEVRMAEAIRSRAAAFRESLVNIPLTARFAVGRWSDLRRAGRVTATLCGEARDPRGPDPSARVDQTMGRVAALLRRRDGLALPRDPRSRTARGRIDRQLRELLLGADLAPALLDGILAALRERRAAVSETGARGQRGPRRDLEREIGLSIPVFLSRMREVEARARALRDARNQFVEHNLKLVVKIAGAFAGMGVSLPDLIQEGNLSLLHAVEKFDHRRGFKFSTYGSWWILQACIRAIQVQSRTVRLPSHVHDRLLWLERARSNLWRRLGRAPTVAELGAEIRLSKEQVEHLLYVQQKPVALEARPSDGDERGVGDVLAHPNSPDPSDTIDRARETSKLVDTLPGLSARERQVLCWRFGLGRERPHTLEEIGRRLDLSRERVRQIEAQALATLGRRLGTQNGPDVERGEGRP